MSSVEGVRSAQQGTLNPARIQRWLAIVALVYLLLCAVGMISSGFKGATSGQAKELFAFATNPFLGLTVATIATALIQSSSTVTSIIVGMVAGGLPISIAVPMVMGANIGTSITNTIVSLGHMHNKEEFRRAFSAATVHDYFNLIAVALFLPLELAFGFLERLGKIAASLVGSAEVNLEGTNFVSAATHPLIGSLKSALIGLPSTYSGTIQILVGVVILFVSILYIGRLLRTLMVGRAKQLLYAAVGKGPGAGIFSGAFVTMLVQSSSTTTSLMVPLAGSGIFTTRQIYPFTLGANIGTCITAVLAATSISGPAAPLARQIALVHLIFNVLGVAIIWSVPALRELPLKASKWLADLATENRLYVLTYILGVFFVLPGLCIVVTQLLF